MTSEHIEADRLRWDEWAPVFQEIIEPNTMISAFSLLSYMRLQQSTRVLEVGCGAGGAASLALRMMAPNTELTLMDLSPEMIKLAEARVLKSGTNGVHISSVQGNIEVLPFESNSFDRLYGVYVIHIISNPQAVLKEARRVVRPGGTVGFVVWGRKENSPKFTIAGDAAEAVGLPRREGGFHLGVENKLKNLMEAAGFVGVTSWYTMEPSLEHTAEEYVHVNMKIPATTKALQGMTQDEVDKYRDTLRRGANQLLENGTPIHSESLIIIGHVPHM